MSQKQLLTITAVSTLLAIGSVVSLLLILPVDRQEVKGNTRYIESVTLEAEITELADIIFSVPADWVRSREYETVVNKDDKRIVFTTSDYEGEVVGKEAPNNNIGILRGARFELTTRPTAYVHDSSVQISQNIVNSYLRHSKNCSNCIEAKQVFISGIPAAYLVTTADNHGGSISVTLGTHNKNIYIRLLYAEESEDYRDVFDEVLNSFIIVSSNEETFGFEDLDFELPQDLILLQENKDSRFISRNYITNDFATSSETIYVLGLPEETETVVKGYRLQIVIGKSSPGQTESKKTLDREQSDKVLTVSDSTAYMKISEGFVVTSIYSSDGKKYSFSMKFPRSVGFDVYESTYMEFLNSIEIK